MNKLIRSEWTKFSGSRKNQVLLLLLVIYIIGIIISNLNAHENYFSKMEGEMAQQKIEAQSLLQDIKRREEQTEGYMADPEEIAYLNIERLTSVILELHYRNSDPSKWRENLNTEIEKYNNLIVGAENSFIDSTILRMRNQQPVQLKQQIVINEYLLENDIEPYPTPYIPSGLQFLSFLLSGYTPMIILALCALLTIDIFLGELEEGSYKMYFTQPFSRSKIYWSKILSSLLFVIGLITVIILIIFIILSAIYSMGDIAYPQAIGTSEVLTSLNSNSEILGQYQIVPTGQYLLFGYSLLLMLMLMIILSTIAISIFMNSISGTVGLVAGVFMLNYVFHSFLSNESILRFIQPLGYSSIDLVVRGQINASYLMGIILAAGSPFALTLISTIKFLKSDLLGSEG